MISSDKDHQIQPANNHVKHYSLSYQNNLQDILTVLVVMVKANGIIIISIDSDSSITGSLGTS